MCKRTLTGWVSSAILLIGCVSTSDTIQSWIGTHESALMAKWGESDKVIPNEPEGKLFIYIKTDPYSSRGADELYLYGSGTRDSDIPGRSTTLRRHYTFWLNREGIIYDSAVEIEEIVLPSAGAGYTNE